jgi:hypothetical protein
MSAVGSCNVGRSQAGASIGMRIAITGLLAFTCCGAFALDDDANGVIVAQATAAERSLPQLEVSASSLPRFDNTDGATRSSRLDMTLLPPKRSALGLSLSMNSLSGPTLAGIVPYAPASPSVDLGLHWRHTMDNDQRLDITAWRRMQTPDAITLIESREPTYGARVEMKLGSASKGGFKADRGFLGFQLESGARITVKRSHGKPMLYYRNKF